MRIGTERFLVAYSGLLTLAVVAALLTGAAGTGRASFDQIDVQRINIREPDGTLRMVLSGKGTFPGAIMGDREYPHERGVAGMIFLNDEGMETGGLIFQGHGGKGEPKNTVHLSFDPYDRDQTMQLTHTQEGDVDSSLLMFRDRSDLSIRHVLEGMERIRALPESEQPAAIKALIPGSTTGPARVLVGKDRDQRSLVDLRDGSGNTRLRLAVTPAGQASIEFLDAKGQVTSRVGPDTLAR